MLKWKMLAGLALSFGVAGVGWGFAQQRTAIGFYELRATPPNRERETRSRPALQAGRLQFTRGMESQTWDIGSRNRATQK